MFDGLSIGSETTISMARLQALLKNERQTLDLSAIEAVSVHGQARSWLVPATAKGGQASPQGAWALAHRVAALGGVRWSDPVLPVPGLDALEPNNSGVALSGSGDNHKAGTENKDWHLQQIRAAAALALLALKRPGEAAGTGVTIAHPDTGYTAHPELIGGGKIKLASAYNFKERTQNPMDPLTGAFPGHGTATASVIMSDPHGDVDGIAPGAFLVPLRVHDSVIHFHWLNVAKAINWAIAKKHHVISMSLGGGWGGRILEEAVQFAAQNGLILIAAAGNNVPFRPVVYPARYPEVIAMAASNINESLWSGSSHGEQIDLTAPGESVWRALVKADASGFPKFLRTERSSGTSYATSIVAGAAAIWLHYYGRDSLLKAYGAPQLAKAFRAHVQKSARAMATLASNDSGPGLLNLEALLSTPLPKPASLSNAALSETNLVMTDLPIYAGLKKSAASANLAAMLGIKPSALKIPKLSAQAQSELSYYLATRSEFAAELRQPAVAASSSVLPSRLSTLLLTELGLTP